MIVFEKKLYDRWRYIYEFLIVKFGKRRENRCLCCLNKMLRNSIMQLKSIFFYNFSKISVLIINCTIKVLDTFTLQHEDVDNTKKMLYHLLVLFSVCNILINSIISTDPVAYCQCPVVSGYCSAKNCSAFSFFFLTRYMDNYWIDVKRFLFSASFELVSIR